MLQYFCSIAVVLLSYYYAIAEIVSLAAKPVVTLTTMREIQFWPSYDNTSKGAPEIAISWSVPTYPLKLPSGPKRGWE